MSEIVVVKDNHIKVSGICYFRASAEEVELGSYGEKKTPLTKQNYLFVYDRIPAANMPNAKSSAFTFDEKNSSKKDFQADVHAVIEGVPVKYSGSATFEGLENNQLKLVKFSVLPAQLVAAINQSPKALDYLHGKGKDARVAHQIFVVMDAKFATKFDNNVSSELAIGKGVLQATIGGSVSSSGSTTVQLSVGTTFAYLLAKLEWNKEKSKIIDLEDDTWSLG